MPKRNSAKPSKSSPFELRIVPLGFTGLLIAVLDNDDPEAQRSAFAVIGWLNRYRRGPGQIDCFVCGSVLLAPPTAAIVMLPLRRAGRRAVVGGLCSQCCALPTAGLMDSTMATIRALMPSAQLHVVPVSGGRA